MASSAAGAVDLLHQQGLRATAQRVAVLRAVADHPHGTADELAADVRAALGTISRQAVYDALGVLVDQGLLRRLQPAGSPARYEPREEIEHHHLICRTCGRIVDVPCATGLPCRHAADDLGFEIDRTEVTFWGRCPDCHATETHEGTT